MIMKAQKYKSMSATRFSSIFAQYSAVSTKYSKATVVHTYEKTFWVSSPLSIPPLNTIVQGRLRFIGEVAWTQNQDSKPGLSPSVELSPWGLSSERELCGRDTAVAHQRQGAGQSHRASEGQDRRGDGRTGEEGACAAACQLSVQGKSKSSGVAWPHTHRATDVSSLVCPHALGLLGRAFACRAVATLPLPMRPCPMLPRASRASLESELEQRAANLKREPKFILCYFPQSRQPYCHNRFEMGFNQASMWYCIQRFCLRILSS